MISTNRFNIKKNIAVFLFFFAGIGHSFCQSISGPATSTAGTNAAYSYNNGSLWPSQNWETVNGTIISQSRSGTTYNVTVKWLCAGDGILRFKNSTTVLQSKTVAVSCPSVAAPSTTFSFSTQCGSTTITRNSNPGFSVTWYWQTESNGERTDLGSAASITVTSGGTYYLRARHNLAPCCWSSALSTGTIAFNAVPATPSITNGVGCQNTQVTLGGSPGTNGDQVKWYDASTGGNYKGSGTSFNTDVLASSTTYYASTVNSSTGCESARVPVTATINPLPSAPASAAAAPSALCGPGNTTLTATGGATGEIYVWYLAATGGSPLAPGAQSVSSTTTFYAAKRQMSTGCESATRASITVVVNPVPATYTVSGSGTYCYSGTGLAVSLNNSQTGMQYQLTKDGSALGGLVSGTGSALAWTNQVAASGGSSTYTVVAANVNGTCPTNMTGSAIITASPSSVGGTIAGALEAYGTASGTLLLAGQTGSVLNWEYNAGGGWTSIANTSATQSFTGVTQSTQYRAVVKSGVCSSAASTPASVVIYPVATIDLNGPSLIAYGGSTELATGAYASYKWVRNGTDIPGTDQSEFTVTEPGIYKVKVKGSASAPEFVTDPVEIESSLLNQPTPVNFVSRTTILKEGFTGSMSPFSLQADEVRQVISYQDGLGRTFQTIGIGMASGGNDVVSCTLYGLHGVPDTTYLPYATESRDGRVRQHALRNGNVYSLSEQFEFYQDALKIKHDAFPYAITGYYPTPEIRAREQGGPGHDWQPGQGHTVRSSVALNTATTVHLWKTDGTCTAYYAANELNINEVTDENGNMVKTYTDKAGRTILKQEQLDDTIDGSAVAFLETYYLYDIYGQVTYVIPPKAMAVLGTGSSLTANNPSIAELIFKNTYDNLGHLIEKKVPGAVPVYYVYDKLDRLVLSQDGNLRTSGKWFFIKYDDKNRPVYSGLYANSNTRNAVQSLFDGISYATAPWFETEQVNSTYHGYSNAVFPTAGLELLAVNYYDHYDYDRNGSSDYVFDNSHLTGLPATASARTRGLATGGKRLILGTSNWLSEALFYDVYDRVIQRLSNNHLNSALQDRLSVLYNFSGNIVQRKNTKVILSETTHQVLRYEYDQAGRVTGIFEKINSFAEQQVAKYEYNALGQLVDKKLHDSGAGAFLQSIDYRYNIRGWLESINNSKLSIDAVNNDEMGDYFGMEFLYNVAESGLNDQAGDKRYYNGNISAIKWKSPGGGTSPANQRSYKYDYDKHGRLKVAKFQEHGGTAWNQEGSTLNEVITYDHNGNIRSLRRYQNLRGLSGTSITSAPEEIDDLAYTYASNTNSLLKVDDAATGIAAQAGFANGAASTSEFFYDNAGNLNKDDNKGITNIIYNILSLPQQIDFADGRRIEYLYDARGQKLRMMIYASGNPTPAVTDYTDGFVLMDSTLSFMSSPEGRVLKRGSNFEYEYAIADHQGNTRVVFTSVPQTPEARTASFEGTPSDDSGNYVNVNTSNVVSFTAANHTQPGGKVVRMNQTYKVGPAKSLAVFPGDKIDLEVWEYHEGGSGWGTTGTPLATLVNLVSGAFGGVSGGAGESGLVYSGVDDALSGFIQGGNQGDSQPAAYLNYILFDKNYKVLDMGWQPAPAATFTKQKISFPTLSIEEAGFIFVYLSYDNDSNNWVYFDDLTVTHTKTNVIQYNEYYPYGLQTAASWTREDSENNFLYNSGTELNNTSGWYETMFRGYDAALGRFLQVDPLASLTSSLSPFQYANNNPVSWNDPTGLAYEGPAPAVYGRVPMRRFPSDAFRYCYMQYDNPNSMYYGMGGPVYGSPGYGAYWSAVSSGAKVGQNEYGQWGYWVDSGYQDEEGAGVQSTFHLAQQGGGEDPAWVQFLKEHYYFEAKSRVTYGPQLAIMPTSGGVVVGPYVRGLYGARINLGSNVLWEGTADSKNGARTTATFGEKFTQGLAVSLGWLTGEYEREVTSEGAANSYNVVFFGILGAEINSTTGEGFIGLMPGASWTLGIGIEGKMKSGFKFKF